MGVDAIEKRTLIADRVTVARRLRALRKMAAWSQPELARRAGVSRSSVRRLENCTSVNVNNLRSCMKALGTPLEDLNRPCLSRDQVARLLDLARQPKLDGARGACPLSGLSDCDAALLEEGLIEHPCGGLTHQGLALAYDYADEIAERCYALLITSEGADKVSK